GPKRVARRSNGVVVSPDEMEITVLVYDPLVAGRHPVADEFVARRVRTLPVFEEHHRVGPAHRDLAEFAGRRRHSVRPDHRDVMAGYRPADGAGTRDAQHGAGRKHEVALALTVELVDDEAAGRAAPLVGL